MKKTSVSMVARGVGVAFLLLLVVALLTGTAQASLPVESGGLSPTLSSVSTYHGDMTFSSIIPLRDLAGGNSDRAKVPIRLTGGVLTTEGGTLVGTLPGAPPAKFMPDSGSIGYGGAFVSVSPEVVSETVTSAVGLVAANFEPNENLIVRINGTEDHPNIANADGRIATWYYIVGGGPGYATFEVIGLSSGRRGGHSE